MSLNVCVTAMSLKDIQSVERLKELFRPFDVKLNEHKYRLEPNDVWRSKFKAASVLIPLYFQDGEWFVLLTQRAKHLNRQPSTVSFPGGMKDGDESAAVTALREAEEEIGLPRECVTLIAHLSPLIVRPMSLVTPFLGVIPTGFVPTVNKEEVDFSFCLPLKRFLSDERHTKKDMIFSNTPGVFHIHYFQDNVNGVEVTTWGFTALLCMQVALVTYQPSQQFCFMDGLITDKDNCFNIKSTQIIGNRLLDNELSTKL